MHAGICYLLSLEADPPYPLTGWQNASDTCGQNGGTLAILNTSEKEKFVDDHFVARSGTSNSPDGYWIGLKRDGSATSDIF